MESELLKVFDEHMNEVGVAPRIEVHKSGYWHETFHCWLVSSQENKTFIYFQLRSDNKKDFPNLLDITAAGHLLSHETTRDGIREVQEELGLQVTFEDLLPLGMTKNSIKQLDFTDNEFCHLFLYKGIFLLEDFKPQLEEVSGIMKAEFNQFKDFWFDKNSELRVEGFIMNGLGERVLIDKMVNQNQFVPHDKLYFQEIIKKISMKI